MRLSNVALKSLPEIFRAVSDGSILSLPFSVSVVGAYLPSRLNCSQATSVPAFMPFRVSRFVLKLKRTAYSPRSEKSQSERSRTIESLA